MYGGYARVLGYGREELHKRASTRVGLSVGDVGEPSARRSVT